MECAWLRFAVIAVASITSVGSAAFAQVVPNVPGAVGQPPQRPERPGEERPPAAVQAEDYSVKGIPFGGFRLFADLEADQIFNDNIYATSPAAGTVAGFVEVIRPSLNLKSNWNNHMLNFYAIGGFGIYSVDPSLNNYQDAAVGGNGRLDIQRDWNVYGAASWNRAHEEHGTPNTPTNPGTPVTIYNQATANAGYFQKFNRLSVRLDGRFDNFNYFNNGLGPAQGVIPNSDRNHNEWREALRFGYEFLPSYEFWVRGALNQRVYPQLDTFGLDRSSNGFDIVGGVLIDLGGITSVEVFAGYLQQNYVSGQFANISTPTFGLTGYWNPIRELWVKPYVRRVVSDSALTSTAAYISTGAGLDVSYLMLPNVQVDGHADYAIADYVAQNGTGGAPYDQYFTFRLGAMYFPTPNFYVGPQYQFTHRTSNQFNGDFSQNVVMLRLGARL
jgi:hypothetical protein